MNPIQIAQAANNGIISCSGSDCSICSLLETTGSVFNYLLAISFAAAVLVLVTAGIFYIFTTGRKRYLEKAKAYAGSGIIGFIMILVGWIIIHTLFSVSGYKNAGNWWQFRCETEYAADTPELENPGTLNTYSDIPNFIASGDRRGIIKKSVSEAVFLNQIRKLKEGERLTFYLPAKKNRGNKEETLVPFLAGVKTKSGISIDPDSQAEILTGLINGISDGSVSLLGSGGSILSSSASDQLIKSLVTGLINSLSSSATGNKLDLFSSLDSLSGPNLTNAIKKVSAALKESIAENPPDTSTVLGKAISNVVKTALGSLDKIAVERSDSKTAGSGDRAGEQEPKTAKKDWSVTNPVPIQKDTLKKNPNPDNKNLPSAQGENPVGPVDDLDKIKDKDKDDTKMCDYSKATNPAEEALIRIECKDELRYNMIHRFVKKISNTDFQGGFCEGCGEIAVNFNFPRELLDQLIMHESTHSGQFCLNIIDNESDPARVEREACANQMGSLCREKHDENEGKGTDDYLMQEITCAGEKGKDGKPILCRQKPHIAFKEIPAGTQDEEVRGYFSRWHVDVSPSGDLKCEAYDWPVQYALSYGDTTMGPYHYGAHHCGENRVLGLKKNENEEVKTIVKSQEQCKSTSRPNLPKAKECEKSGAPPIEIDAAASASPGM